MIMMVIMNVTCTVVFHALQQNLHIKNIQDDSDPLIEYFWVKFDYEKFFVLTLFTGFLACVSDSFTPAATPTIPFTVSGGLFICAFGGIVILITTHTTSLLTSILDSLTKTTESFDSSTPLHCSHVSLHFSFIQCKRLHHLLFLWHQLNSSSHSSPSSSSAVVVSSSDSVVVAAAVVVTASVVVAATVVVATSFNSSRHHGLTELT